jgi:putative ABC transport system permease protein
MALGATSARVLTVVMKEGAVLVAIGTVIGLAGSWACSRALASVNGSVGRVTSVNTDDPMVVVGATVLLATMALLACYVPARKSTRIDPAIALRHE